MRIKRKQLLLYIGIILAIIILIEMTSSFSDDPIIVFYRFILGGILVYCITKGLAQKDIFNPYIYFSLTPLSLLIYTERVSNVYLEQLNNSTWLFGIINMVAFLFVLSRVSKGRRYVESNAEIRKLEHRPTSAEAKMLIMHSLILICLGEFSLVFKLLTGYSVIISTIISYCVYPGITMAWKSKDKRYICFVYAIILLTFTVSFNKTAFLGYALITFLSYERYYRAGEKYEIRRFSFLIICALLFIFVAFPLKGLIQDQKSFSIANFISAISSYANNVNDYYVNSIIWKGPSVLKFPYMYLVSSWNNVQYVMETQTKLTYGLWMLKPIISWLQLDGFISDSYVLIPYSSFNTFGFCTIFFKDFGFWGSIIGSLFLGWFVGRIYNNYRVSKSAFNVAIYSVVSQATIEMFFSNHFFMLSYPFTIVIVCVIYKEIFKSSRNL